MVFLYNINDINMKGEVYLQAVIFCISSYMGKMKLVINKAKTKKRDVEIIMVENISDKRTIKRQNCHYRNPINSTLKLYAEGI